MTSYELVLRPGLLEALKTTNGHNSDRQLATALGIGRGTLGRLNEGQAPTANVIAAIAKMLGTNDLNRVAVLVRAEPKPDMPKYGTPEFPTSRDW